MAATGSAWLVFSFPPFPVRRFSDDPGTGSVSSVNQSSVPNKHSKHSGRWPLSSSTVSHRRNAACYSWLKGTKRSLGIATTTAAAAAVAARAPNDREAVDHGSVGRATVAWHAARSLVSSRTAAAWTGFSKLELSKPLLLFVSSRRRRRLQLTVCLLQTSATPTARARGARSANQTWKYKLISCWKLRNVVQFSR